MEKSSIPDDKSVPPIEIKAGGVRGYSPDSPADDSDTPSTKKERPRRSPKPPQPTLGGGEQDSGSRIIRKSGKRKMREYPLSEGELGELAGLGLLATGCFSVASLALGFAIDTSASLAFSPDLPDTVKTFWGTLRGVAWAVTALFAALGGFFLWRGNTRVQEIKDDTDHEE